MDRTKERWRHKPTRVLYWIAYSVGAVHELHSMEDRIRYAKEDDLKNSDVWEKLP